MNLIFNADNRPAFAELKTALNDKNIKYKVVDDDGCRVSFNVSKDKVNDFQMDLVNNVIGARVPGTFLVDND